MLSSTATELGFRELAPVLWIALIGFVVLDVIRDWRKL